MAGGSPVPTIEIQSPAGAIVVNQSDIKRYAQKPGYTQLDGKPLHELLAKDDAEKAKLALAEPEDGEEDDDDEEDGEDDDDEDDDEDD